MQVFVPVAGATLVWWLNERSKRAWEAYKRREQSYSELLTTLRGFYELTEDPDPLNPASLISSPAVGSTPRMT